MRHISSRLKLLGATLAALVALPAAAQAACPAQTSRQVFSRFGDTNWYYAAPGGTFESGSAAWTLSGASLANGNETFFVNGSSDSRSLRLPAGASALSPWFCISVEHPHMRLVARKLSGSGGSLKVELLTSAATRSAGSIANTGQYLTWRPTPVLNLATLLSLTGTATATVRLRLTADSGGPWGVDDVFLDPYRR